MLIKCLISIFQLYKCSLFGFLVVFKDLHCVATTEDVSMGTSSIPNLGLPRKIESTIKVLVQKQQPNLQMQAYSINLCSVLDIASALRQG